MNNQHPRFTFGFTITLVVVTVELLLLGPLSPFVASILAFPLMLQAIFAWKWDQRFSQVLLGGLALIHLAAVYLDYRVEFIDHPNAQAGIGFAVASFLAIPVLVIGWFGIGIYNAKANHQPIRIFH